MKQMLTGGKSEADAEKKFFETARPASILKRFITPGEVAHCIAYFCGAGASATNGASVRVDGGVIRAIG